MIRGFGLSDPAFLALLGGRFDPDAQAYITAVETADGQALEAGVRTAINAFVVGCKVDGIWSAIKASCIMAGARTLNGALVPLVGAAPTRFGTEGEWNYNRKTGLQGNGTDNYLDSSRSDSADPQNDFHASVYASVAATGTQAYLAGSPTSAPSAQTLIARNNSTNSIDFRCRSVAVGVLAGSPGQALFLGMSRSVSANFNVRQGGSATNSSKPSSAPASDNILIFARNTSPIGLHSDARLAFYSIGESLNLALLDARVKTLMDSLQDFRVSFQSRVTLPDGALGSDAGKGWTCTGLHYDSQENVWWVANDGRAVLGSPHIPSIIKMDFNATTILQQIDVKSIFPDNTTIQGLTIDPQNDSIWFAALQENKIRNITKAGVSLGELSFGSPNGLAYDSLDNTLIVYDSSTVSVINKNTGSIVRTYSASLSGGDHLYFNPVTRHLHISYGVNGSPGNIAIYNHDTGQPIKSIGPFAEVTAAEGIWIIDNNIYFLSNGYFHPGGPVDLNQLMRYSLLPPAIA